MSLSWEGIGHLERNIANMPKTSLKGKLPFAGAWEPPNKGMSVARYAWEKAQKNEPGLATMTILATA